MEWRIIPSFPGYLIDEVGGVKRMATGNLLKGSVDKLGRRLVKLIGPEGKKAKLVSRLVAEAFIGPAPNPWPRSRESILCLHRDGDCANNYWGNIYYGTQQQNIDDRNRHGRTCRGEFNGNSKLTPDQVSKIRAAYKRGRVTKKWLGARFGVSGTMIAFIINKKNWKHLP